MCVAPGGDRVRLVETDRPADGLPKPLDIGLAEHGLGPALVRIGDDRPVAEAVGQLQRRLGDLAHPRLADALAVEIGEELGLRVAGDRDQRAAGLAELAQALDEPRRREAELVVGRVRDVRAPHVLIGVEHVDITRARLVGLRERSRARAARARSAR